MNSLEPLFNARSVAVVGASADPAKFGNIILKNIIDGGYEGKIYPINPRSDSILGFKCYKSLGDVPGEIDVAVIVIPARFVPDVMDDAGKKNVKGALIISGGFREIGNFELENKVTETAEKHGIRVIGPNCQGFNYTPNKLCASWPLITKQGPIAVISQSGTIGATMEMWAQTEKLGISGFVALGNKSDVNEIDLIDFFAEDPSTKVISLYIEGVGDGAGFIKTVRKIGGEKPIVVLKPGRTEKGRRAAESHTSSIAGKDEIFEGVCRQLGITRAGDITELCDFSKAFGFLKKPDGNNMLVITSSGGCGILATDTAEENGINIVILKEDIRKELKDTLPEPCVIANPLDLTGDAPAERFRDTVRTASKDSNIDFFLLIFGDPIPGAFEVVSELKQEISKEIVVCYLGGGEVEKEEVSKMQRHGIPVFPTPERAVNAVKVFF
jgi:acetyl coenzyme A synthetase (ADP forming)-like protein